MAELFDKEGNPVGDVFDVDGNPIDEALTPDEVETKITEAKDEVKGGFETEIQKKQDLIDEKEDALKKAEEDLGKEKEKDKNFKNLRDTTEEKGKEVETLREELDKQKIEIEEIKTATKKQPVNTMIGDLAAGDEELEKKIKFHYESFTTPEKDTPELQKERIKNAYFLAAGGKTVDPLTGDVISSGGGAAPEAKEVDNKGKLENPASSEVGEKLGLSKEKQRRNKLI